MQVLKFFYMLSSAFFLIPILGATPCFGEECIEYSDYLHLTSSLATPGHSCDVAFSGNLAVVADGTGGLQIVDATDPINPYIVGTIPHPPYAMDSVALQDSFAYVGDGYNRKFYIVDFRNPVDPQIVGEADTEIYPCDIAVLGEYAYIATQNVGLQIFDISEPVFPMLIHTVSISDYTCGVAIMDRYAYVAGISSGLHVVDITDPTSAHVVGSVDTPNEWDESNAVAVSHNNAFLVGTRLYVIDITQPKNPQIVSSVSAYGEDITVVGDYAFVAGGYLKIVDISIPASPQIIGWVDQGGWAKGIATLGNLVYVAAWDASIQIVDFSTPASPQFLGMAPTPGNAVDVDCYGNLAVVADDTYLLVLDISDPINPFYTNTMDTPGLARGVKVVDGYAYVADMHQGLQIVSLANPYIPVIVGNYNTPDLAYDVSILDNWAYVADGVSGVHVVDVSLPHSPQLVAVLNTPGRAIGVAADGNLLLVADFDEDLLVVNISIPDNPQILDSVEFSGYAHEVAIKGDQGFVAASSMLHAVDLSTPTDSEITDSYLGDFLAITIDGKYIYASGDDLHIIDASDPSDLLPVGSIPLPYSLSSAAVTNGCVCVVGQELFIVPLQCSGLTPVQEYSHNSPPTLDHMTVHPNPFNPHITISFSLDRFQEVNIAVYAMTGRLVKVLSDQSYGLGNHSVDWNGHDSSGHPVSSSTYLVRMETEDIVESRKVMLVR